MTSSARRPNSRSAERRGRRAAAIAGLLLAALASLSQAQTQTLQVRPADRELLTQEPRQIVALAFNVRNATDDSVDVEPRLVLPEGWRPVTRELPFQVARGETVTRLTSFMIPETARAGEYAVTYDVQDRLRPSAHGSYAIRVRVLAAPKLQALPLDTPDFAVAGERYQVTFLVRNTGNSTIRADFKARSASGVDCEPRAGTIELAPGESKSIAIEAVASVVRRRTTEHLTLTFEVPDTDVRASAIAATQVVPRVSADDAYRTLATRMDVGFISSQAGERKTSGWQTALSGTGALDEARQHEISFILRRPDARQFGALGTTDEYWLQYRGSGVTATVGDSIYGLSLLTEPGRQGRGAEIDLSGESWGMSAYQARDRFSATQSTQDGLNAYYEPSSTTRLGVNLLRNAGARRAGTLGSLRGEATWFGGLSTDVELAQSLAEGESERGQAFQVNVYDTRYAVDYYVLGWRADPHYLGYLQDEEYWSAGFDYPRDNWGLHGFSQVQDRNLDADPARPTPHERRANLGIDRQLSQSTSLALDYDLRTLADRHAAIPVDRTNHSGRIRLMQSFQNISALYTLERGRTEDRATGRSFNTSQHLLSAYWQPSDAQSYGFNASRDEGGFAGEPGAAQTTLGLSASYRLFESTSFYLDVQQNRTATGRHNSYNASLFHERPDGKRLSVLFRRIEGLVPHTDMLVSYSMPFAVPIARRSGVSTVRGRVYDAETGAGVRNVVLSLDGLTAVTDNDGEFTFPAVRVGSYRLSMDRTNVDVEKVPRDAMPLELAVTEREAKRVEIALVRSAAVEVTVSLRGNAANGIHGAAAAHDAQVTGAERILVVLSNGGRDYRRLTDADGRVRLAGLPPGEWVATVASETIPEGYRAAINALTLHLTPDGPAVASFSLEQTVRDVKMLPPLRLQ